MPSRSIAPSPTPMKMKSNSSSSCPNGIAPPISVWRNSTPMARIISTSRKLSLGRSLYSATPYVLSPPGSGRLSKIVTAAPCRRSSAAPETFVLIHGLQNFKKLRQEDEFSFSSGESATVNPAAVLQNLISDGPAHGIHIIATCDTYNNVNRFLGRKTLTEFEMRVLFQMSASDSASLVESPDAGTLGLHRALFYNDREGYTEIFRPYARPGNEWIEEIARKLALRK